MHPLVETTIIFVIVFFIASLPYDYIVLTHPITQGSKCYPDRSILIHSNSTVDVYLIHATCTSGHTMNYTEYHWK